MSLLYSQALHVNMKNHERPGTNFNWAVPAGGYLGNGQFNNNSLFYKSSFAVFN